MRNHRTGRIDTLNDLFLSLFFSVVNPMEEIKRSIKASLWEAESRAIGNEWSKGMRKLPSTV